MNGRAGQTRFGDFELDATSVALLRDGRRIRIQAAFDRAQCRNDIRHWATGSRYGEDPLLNVDR
jgi:hypothetical protein